MFKLQPKTSLDVNGPSKPSIRNLFPYLMSTYQWLIHWYECDKWGSLRTPTHMPVVSIMNRYLIVIFRNVDRASITVERCSIKWT